MNLRIFVCRMQGIPPKYRPWVWMHLSGALEKQRDHMANYYTAMVHMGESTSEFAHQIELVRALTLAAACQSQHRACILFS